MKQHQLLGIGNRFLSAGARSGTASCQHGPSRVVALLWGRAGPGRDGDPAFSVRDAGALGTPAPMLRGSGSPTPYLGAVVLSTGERSHCRGHMQEGVGFCGSGPTTQLLGEPLHPLCGLAGRVATAPAGSQGGASWRLGRSEPQQTAWAESGRGREAAERALSQGQRSFQAHASRSDSTERPGALGVLGEQPQENPAPLNVRKQEMSVFMPGKQCWLQAQLDPGPQTALGLSLLPQAGLHPQEALPGAAPGIHAIGLTAPQRDLLSPWSWAASLGLAGAACALTRFLGQAQPDSPGGS